MNYKESSKILQLIKKSKRILINAHRGPDPDSIGSSMALRRCIENMNKDVNVVCPTSVASEFMFIDGANKIKRVDFSKFNFSKFDLFIVLDSASWTMVLGSGNAETPKITTVVIDHHFSNDKFGTINMVDAKTTSTAEVLYNVFNDWKVKIDEKIAQSLLTGIISDTGSFQYKGVGRKTLMVASKLIEKGADKDLILDNLVRNVDFKEIKLWGKFIEKMVLEEDYGFVWSALPASVYKDYGEISFAKEDAAGLFGSIVRDTEFGIIMMEIKEKLLSISFRSRGSFDVSKLASELGGGGHKVAAGARVEGLNFNDAVDKVVKIAKKYAKKTS